MTKVVKEMDEATLGRLRVRRDAMMRSHATFCTHALITAFLAVLYWTAREVDPDYSALIAALELWGWGDLLLTSFFVVGAFWGAVLVWRTFLTACRFKDLPNGFFYVGVALGFGAVISLLEPVRELTPHAFYTVVSIPFGAGVILVPVMVSTDMQRELGGEGSGEPAGSRQPGDEA